MSIAKTNRNIKGRKTSNDKIYTPKPVAIKMIEMCDIHKTDKVLDPSFGEGVFYNNLPECKKSYCEIELNKDFFNETERYDLIFGNPPFSIWDKWIEHTMKLTDKFCYIMGCFNFTDCRVRKILNNGYGITKFHLLKIDWWFSPSLVVLFEKNKPDCRSGCPEAIPDYCEKHTPMKATGMIRAQSSGSQGDEISKGGHSKTVR